jgi:adenylate kinase family enzyme
MLDRVMKRVMIVGGPGSGKSTLAQALGAATGLPVFYMDHIHWKPGWQERSMEEKDGMTCDVHAKERWIFEGGHSRTYSDRLSRADTLIWIDLPIFLRLWRVLKRTVRDRGRSRPDLPDDCPERINMETLHFLNFIWRTRNSSRDKVSKIAKNPPAHMTVHHLQSAKEVREFLGDMAQSPDLSILDNDARP